MTDGSIIQDTSSPIVFLGLSLSVDEAREILGAEYRGPIRKGDLDAIAAPATVVIIDGVLDENKRLPTSEALEALRRGVALYGASSTGALLAVDLARDGMEGFGRVFDFLRWFPDDKQDLVALLYVEGDDQPVTVPLINIVLACQDIGSSEVGALMRTLVSIPLHDRTWDSINSALSKVGFSLPRAIRKTDAKRDDARALLAWLRAGVWPSGRSSQTDGSSST